MSELPKGAICIINSAAGQYIPQEFIEKYPADRVLNLNDKDRAILRFGPEHELYDEVWDHALNEAVLILGHDTRTRYKLHQYEDLFAVPEDVDEAQPLGAQEPKFGLPGVGKSSKPIHGHLNSAHEVEACLIESFHRAIPDEIAVRRLSPSLLMVYYLEYIEEQVTLEYQATVIVPCGDDTTATITCVQDSMNVTATVKFAAFEDPRIVTDHIIDALCKVFPNRFQALVEDLCFNEVQRLENAEAAASAAMDDLAAADQNL